MAVRGTVETPGEESATPSVVRALAAELLPAVAELGRGMAEHLAATMPELGDGGEELRAETRASCEANIDQVLRLLRSGANVHALVVPVEASRYVRGFVHRGIPLPAVLRSYRLGHGWLWDRWCRALQERIGDADEFLAAQEHRSAFMFAYVDQISDELVSEYPEGDVRRAPSKRRALGASLLLR
jgi:hypothetical protein